MRYWLLMLCLFQSLTTTLDAKEPIDRIPLSEVAGDPSSLVAGCVNVISGAYKFKTIDLVVPGPVPLTFQRSYSSLAASSMKSLGNGWSSNHPTDLELTHLDYVYTVIAPEPSGTSLVYLSDRRLEFQTRKKNSLILTPSNHTSFHIHNPDYEDGLTNTHQGTISGRSNFQNQTVSYRQPEETIRLHLATGGERIYKRIQDNRKAGMPVFFRLNAEYLPDGNHIMHEYATTGFGLSKIKGTDASNSCMFGELQMKTLSENSAHLGSLITSNDGRKIAYENEARLAPDEKQPRYYLSKVKPSNGPTEIYTYGQTTGTAGLRIKRRELPENRFLNIDYYGVGDNWVGDQLVHVRPYQQNDRTSGRVSLLSAPVGWDDTPVITYRFFYRQDQTTDVRNAYNNRTVYGYTTGDRLTNIIRYVGTSDSTYTKYSSEKLFWGKSLQKQHGNLICRALLDANETICSCRYYEYDKHHNTIAEHLLGNLSGSNLQPPVLDMDGLPQDNGCDRYTVRYTYTDDKFHLKTSETYANGLTIVFKYKPNSDLLKAKLTCEGNRIVQREFREYDANATLVQIIEDDGCGKLSKDLNGITFRKITYLTPRKEAPCMGLPAVVANAYYDISKGSEISLGYVMNSYSPEGLLTEQKHYISNDIVSHTLRWEYDALGNAILEQNALGQIIRRRFDANGNKVYEKNDRLPYHYEYVYDYSNRIVAEERVCDDGQHLKNSYRYDYLGNRIASIDPFGHETTYKYDDLGRLISTVLPASPDAQGSLKQPQVSLEYDVASNIIAETDSEGNVTTKTYNARGQQTVVNYPNGTTERFEYNLDGSMSRKILKNGNSVALHYDLLGNKVKEETSSQTGEILATTSAKYRGKQLISETDANGNTTSYEYDGAGRCTLVHTPEGWSRFEYDNRNRKVKSIQWVGPANTDVRSTINAYDVLDRLIEEQVQDALGNTISCIQTQYDDAGNCSAVTTFSGSESATKKTLFNARGKPCKLIDALGNENIIHYDYAYLNDQDQRVLQVTSVDALGNRTVTTHNPLGQVVSIIQLDPKGKELSEVRKSYKGNNQLVKIAKTITTKEGCQDVATEWRYDSAGNIVAIYEAAGSPLARQTHFTYDTNGQKEAETLPNGVTISHQYDAIGRLSYRGASDGSFAYHYAYDACGNVVSIADQQGSTLIRKYDHANRLIEEQLATGLSIFYQYDGLNRITTIGLSNGSGIHYNYDTAHLLEICRVDASGTELYNHKYLSRDHAGHVTAVRMIGKAGAATYSWDIVGRLRKQYSTHFEEEVSVDGIDAIGNLVSKTQHDIVGKLNCHYTYDGLSRLITEEGSSHHIYNYDLSNNRSIKDNSDCDINALQQLTRQGAQSYTYDACGNRTKLGDYQLSYDALGRLTQVTSLGKRWTYAYDAFNRRSSKTAYDNSNNVIDIEQYLYQGDIEIGMTDARGNLRQLRVLGESHNGQVSTAVAIEIGEHVYAPLHDRSGNVTALLTTDSGDVVEAYRYTAFGEQTHYVKSWWRGWIANTSPAINPWGFAGQRHDAETGLIQFGAKYLDSDTGRWMTPEMALDRPDESLYQFVPRL